MSTTTNGLVGDRHQQVVSQSGPADEATHRDRATRAAGGHRREPTPRSLTVRMAAIAVEFPESTKTSVHQRLLARARERWPQITALHVRHRSPFTSVTATTTEGAELALCRLRYVCSAQDW